MKKYLLATVLVAVIASTNAGMACGDKFLVSSRGTRYQRAPVARDPAVILVYLDPASEAGKALATFPIDGTLRKAGYRPTLLTSRNEFESALGRGGWDLVVVGLEDAQSVSQRVSGKSGVLPVVVKAPSAAEVKHSAQYPVVLKAPARGQSFLDAVDDALAVRQRVSAKSVKRNS